MQTGCPMTKQKKMSNKYSIPHSLKFMFKKNLFFKRLLIILLLLTGKNAIAQFGPENTLDVNAIYVPQSKYTQKNGQVENTEKTQKRMELNYSFPISTKFDPATKKLEKWTGIVSGGYTEMSGKTNTQDVMPEKLLNTMLGVTYLRTMRNKWAMVSLLTAGVNTDLKGVDYHDFFISGGVLFIKTPRQGFSYGFGAFVVNALNAPIVLPGLMLHLETEGRFKFNIDIPTEVSIARDVTKKLELKLAVRFKNTSYDTENTVEPKRRYLNYTELPAGLETKFKSKHFDFVLGGGYMILRNYELREGGIKNLFTEGQINKLGGNFYVNAGIRLKFNKEGK